jgi:hypothetical protein
MKGLRYEDEHYVRVYTTDTVEWDMLPWQSKALWSLLERKFDRAGILELGKHGLRGLVHAVKLPVEVVEPGLAGLIEDGWVEQRGTTLIDPAFLASQETPSSDKQRAKEYRARKRIEARCAALGEQPPTAQRDDEATERDGSSQNVTEHHDESHDVTDRHSDPICADPSVEERESTHAGATPQAPGPAPTPGIDDVREAFVEATGAVMFDGLRLRDAARLVDGYVQATGQPRGEVIRRAMVAFAEEVATWTHARPLSPDLFCRQWEAIQTRMAGKVTKGRGKRDGPSSGAMDAATVAKGRRMF